MTQETQIRWEAELLDRDGYWVGNGVTYPTKALAETFAMQSASFSNLKWRVICFAVGGETPTQAPAPEHKNSGAPSALSVLRKAEGRGANRLTSQ